MIFGHYLCNITFHLLRKSGVMSLKEGVGWGANLLTKINSISSYLLSRITQLGLARVYQTME
jgi:hypothetical protein